MTKYLHIALWTLLGTALLAGCQRAEDNGAEADPLQAKGEPVKVSLTLNVHGIGQGGVLTKADYVDYTDLDEDRRYDFENNILDCKLFVFKPDAAAIGDLFEEKSGIMVPKDGAFVRVTSDEEEVLFYQNVGQDRWRLEFKLADTYKSLVVIALANVGTAADGATGSTPAEVIDWLQKNGMDTKVTNQADYVDGKAGILMHGMKCFGVDAELRYWRNMSTPLTVKGFKDAAELEHYTKDSGATRPEDRLVLRHGVARLRVSYNPATDQLPYGSKEVKEGADPKRFVEITSVKLHNYDTKVRFLPRFFGDPVDAQLNPFSPKEDSLFTVMALQTTQGDVEFVHPKGDPDESEDYSWVAYVPEQPVTGNPAADPYEDPYLIVTVKLTDWDKDHNKTEVEFIFERDKITRKWAAASPEGVVYLNSPWTEWLQMQNIYAPGTHDGLKRKDIDGNDVSLGKYYNLVRNYAYEWIAEGLEGLVL